MMVRLRLKYTGMSVNVKGLRLELNNGSILIPINFILLMLI